MHDIIRDSTLGQIIRLVTNKRYLKYPEERDDWQCPPAYLEASNQSTFSQSATPRAASPGPGEKERETDPEASAAASRRHSESIEPPPITLTRTHTTPYSQARLEEEQQLEIQRTKSRPIAPERTKDGIVLVDWYSTDDPENPQNWSSGKKLLIAIIISILTFVFYCGSAIYTPSEGEVMEIFHVKAPKAALGLSLYVLAYGIGPLFFAPLSEVPVIGRNATYVPTFAIFTILCVPTALVDNLAGLLVLRFLQGFWGSTCLANGGASMQDMYSLLKLPYLLSLWVSAAYCGPALGPLLSGYAVMEKGWRWSLWEMLWMAGPTFILMFILLPETSAANILLRRAKRLRARTGNPMYRSQSEIDQGNLKIGKVMSDAIIKPLEITIKDPAVLFTNLYAALTYGIYYSFFEAFPIVYNGFYGFSIGAIGVIFLCILVSCLIGIAIYVSYYYFYLERDIVKNGLREQESRLVPALFAVFGPPAGLFLFGWTARHSIHWIVPTIGIVIYGASGFVIFQCIFVYLPLSYPMYAASLFAGNDFFRSALASGAVIFARPLYLNLGVGPGISLLAGCSIAIGVTGMYVLYFFGKQLRARSKFAVA